MDGIFSFKIIKTVVAIIAMMVAGVSLLILWRFRGILNWKRSLRNELKFLKAEAEKTQGNRRKALYTVLQQCQTAWGASFSELMSLSVIFQYLRTIAGCFHPDTERPELQITFGQCIGLAQELVWRLEQILCRPGFRRLQGVRVRHIRKSYDQYDRWRKSALITFINRYLKRVYHLHWVFFPDPLSIIAYFSNRFTIIALTRCLLVDVYAYLGKLAIQAYGQSTEPISEPGSKVVLEKALEGLESLKDPTPPIVDPITDLGIQEIRNRLVGYTTLLTGPPGLDDWNAAIKETATVTAKKYFPNVDHPLEELALGPLLERSQIWVKTLYDTEKLPVVKGFHGVRLASLYAAKTLSDRLLPQPVRAAAKTSWTMYRWMRRPFRLYRLMRKTSPAAITLQVGWLLARRGMVNVIYRYTFDTIHQEIEIIYRESSSAVKSDEIRNGHSMNASLAAGEEVHRC